MSGVFAAGLILLAAAAAGDLLGLPHPGRGWASGLPYLLGAAGCGCLAAVGGAALAGGTVRLGVGGLLGQAIPGQQTLGLAADRLSGLFLVMALGAAVPVSVAFASWAARPGSVGRKGLAASYALAIGSLAVIFTGTDAFTVLFAWESLTVAFYLLAGFQRGRAESAGAAQITFAFGKISGAALLAGLLLLVTAAHSISLASFTQVPGGAARTTALVLLLGGFAVKVGLAPFQVWLPRGYTAAPGPARAIMAGVCVNAGFYGMWRTFSLLGRPPGWLAGVLLLLAGFTALLGIAHAAVANRLPRVIAYSSVENSGLIIVGFGVALTGAAVRDQRLIAAGLLAATLQMIAHTAAKSLLFTASAGIEAAAGSDDLETLRGMGRRTPWSGTGLAIGSLTLAGLPPTAGFVSEWFLLESLMQQFRVPGLGYRLVLALAGAAVALTAGFAGVTFVRLVGLVVLGQGRQARRVLAGQHGDYGWAGRAALVLLSVYPLAIAAVTPLEIRVIARGLSPVVPAAVISGALKSPWVLQPVFAGFSILSPSWLWIDIPVLTLLVGLFAWAVSGRRLLRVRRVPAWHSATIGVEGADSYTAFGYANPTRRVLANVLHTRSEVRELVTEGGAELVGEAGGAPEGMPATLDGGPEPGAEPDLTLRGAPHLGYTSDVIEVVEAYGYRPVARSVMAIVAVAKRLQSGRLDAYLLYMLIALIAVIAVVTALA
jgi:hydrogenase-4 component B